MRRAFQLVENRGTLERWLAEAAVGRLATIDEHGYPIIKPVNFVYSDGKIYFHCALTGEKLDDIRRNPKVGFETDRVFAVTPPPERGCQTHCFYESIVARGHARILDNSTERPAKEEALRLLVAKYAPRVADRPLDTTDQTAVVEIAVEHMTGKEDFGQRWSAETKVAVARLLRERDGAAADETIRRMGVIEL
jgi:nitroimidazol reductase NimA-like FMN-containing flavoprotein (pyridoxamine 5'-phosphate oxidase superfamily)